jgi:hypothetical protein
MRVSKAGAAKYTWKFHGKFNSLHLASSMGPFWILIDPVTSIKPRRRSPVDTSGRETCCGPSRESNHARRRRRRGRRPPQVARTSGRGTAATAPQVAPARRRGGDRGALRPGHPRPLRRDVQGRAPPRRGGPGLPRPPPSGTPTASCSRSCAAT